MSEFVKNTYYLARYRIAATAAVIIKKGVHKELLKHLI
jgi:hypothetical protein